MGRGREVGFINGSVFGKAGQAAAEYLAKAWLEAVDGRIEFGAPALPVGHACRAERLDRP